MIGAVSCHLLHAGHTRIGPSWSYRMSDTYWRLYWNDVAGAAILHEGGRIELPGERAVLVPPYGRFRSCCQREGISHLFVHLDLPGMPAAWIRRHIPLPRVLRRDPGIDGVLGVGRTLVGTPSGQLRLQSAAGLALAQVLADWDGPERGLRGDHASIAPALAWIASGDGLGLSVAGLAAVCDLSPDHFTRCFRRVIGVTPARWLLHRRLERAAGRLATTTDPVDAIAIENGFADRFHLSRAFSVRFGLPPARYRTQQRAGDHAGV
jgi:AraC-like DNA-binding protein